MPPSGTIQRQHPLSGGALRQRTRNAPAPRRARGGDVASDNVNGRQDAVVESSGPTVDDAIDVALDELDLDEDQVDIEVLAEGGNGEPARVRVVA
ncbi:MAG TPA: Jag N-terminal domain-containing protein, partial [Chloroflexota bacterium]|nr:Jag N-terminal domain-containing protein [Chloroflexota bacterium]